MNTRLRRFYRIIVIVKQVEVSRGVAIFNAEETSKILEESGIDMIIGRGLADTAQKVVAAIQ